MVQPTLDELDCQLIEILSNDARVSNRKIAAQLGVTEGTVRVRIRRLQRDRLIAFTAITGFAVGKRYQLGFISIQAELPELRVIANQIAALPMVKAVLITLGQFNITAMALFDDVEALVELASDQILSIDGVRHIETSIAAKTVKYNTRMVKIMSSDDRADEPAVD